jgi:hypothetical protein
MIPGTPVHFTATGDIDTSGARVPIAGFVLTPAAAVATAVVRKGGSGGTIVLSLQAAANGASVVCDIPSTIESPHVTLGGTGVLFTAFI